MNVREWRTLMRQQILKLISFDIVVVAIIIGREGGEYCQKHTHTQENLIMIG